MSRLYDIHGLVQFHLRRGKPGGRLQRLLDPFETKTPAPSPIELNLYRFPSSLRGADHGTAGKYKGIPWRMAGAWGSDGLPRRVDFAAPAFMSFLALRMIVIPCLHRALVAKGGFYVPGSAFALDGKTVVLFGPPGVGKTHCALRAIAAEACPIADGALLIAASGLVMGLLNEIEIRYATVRDSGLWRTLPVGTRGRLLLYHVISWLTRRHLSFNVGVSPDALCCRGENDREDREHAFLAVGGNGEAAPLAPRNLAERIVAFYDWYAERFRTIVPMIASSERAVMQGNLERVLDRAALWKVPADSSPESIREILAAG